MKKDKEIISGKELLARLRAVDWKDLLPKLHYYSLDKLYRFPILEGRFNVENLATYYADEAVRMVWEEERTWNINAYADVYTLLKGIVDSMVYAFVRSPEVRLTDNLPDNDSDLYDYNANNPESDLIAKEIELEINTILEHDKEAAEVFDCLKDGLKPREISKELNISSEQVYNILKRVYRKLKEYKVKLKAG